MTHIRMQFAAAMLVAGFVLMAPAGVRAGGDYTVEGAAKTRIERKATLILGVAHPTVTYNGIQFLGQNRTFNGFELVYRFDFTNANANGDRRYTNLAFGHNASGGVESISSRGQSGFIPPFFGSDLTLNVLRNALLDSETVQERPNLRRLIEQAQSSRQLLIYFLRFGPA